MMVVSLEYGLQNLILAIFWDFSWLTFSSTILRSNGNTRCFYVLCYWSLFVPWCTNSLEILILKISPKYQVANFLSISKKLGVVHNLSFTFYLFHFSKLFFTLMNFGHQNSCQTLVIKTFQVMYRWYSTYLLYLVHF